MKHGGFPSISLKQTCVHPMSGHGSFTSPKSHRSLLVEPAPEPPLRSCELHPPQTWYHPRPGDVHLRSAHKILGFPNQRDKAWMIFGFPPWKLSENINPMVPVDRGFSRKTAGFPVAKFADWSLHWAQHLVLGQFQIHQTIIKLLRSRTLN